MTPEEIKENYISELYNDFRYSIEKFDSQALYLSSGALALSLTFLKDIVPIEQAHFLWLYYISLILFGVSILIGFLAHYISARLIMVRIKDVEKDKFEVKDSLWISFLNGSVIGTLVIGIGLLITFTIVNMNSLLKTTQNEKNKILIEKSIDGKSMLKIVGEVKNCNFIDTVKLNSK